MLAFRLGEGGGGDCVKENGGHYVGGKTHRLLTVGHLLCVIPCPRQTKQSGKLRAAGNGTAHGSHRLPRAFRTTARVRGGSTLGRALSLCPRFYSRAMVPGVGKMVWKPWQSGVDVEHGEGPVMAGSVLGLCSQGAAGPQGTQGAGRMGVPAQPCPEGRRQQVRELSGEQRTNGAMETTAEGMQGPCCQIHSFVGDCLQSYGLICCFKCCNQQFS